MKIHKGFIRGAPPLHPARPLRLRPESKLNSGLNLRGNSDRWTFLQADQLFSPMNYEKIKKVQVSPSRGPGESLPRPSFPPHKIPPDLRDFHQALPDDRSEIGRAHV